MKRRGYEKERQLKNGDWERCLHWLSLKGRYCNHHRKDASSSYCPLHSNTDKESEGDAIRVPCPLDPAHTVYEHRLHKHLKKCNAAKLKAEQERLPYIVKDINKTEQDPEERRLLAKLVEDASRGYIAIGGEKSSIRALVSKILLTGTGKQDFLTLDCMDGRSNVVLLRYAV